MLNPNHLEEEFSIALVRLLRQFDLLELLELNLGLAISFLTDSKIGIEVIKKSDWKTKHMPDFREDLGYEAFFYDSDAERIMAGHKPLDMDDKWFVYSESGWVYFVCSWTGNYIYAFQLAGSPAGGSRVIASWVNSDSTQYRSPGKQANIDLLNNLMKSLFNVSSNTKQAAQVLSGRKKHALRGTR